MSAALLATRKQEIINKVKACIEIGNRLYKITLPNVSVRFDLKGRSAGIACRDGAQYSVRFNTDMMMRDAWDHIINDTVPHEIAHSFCQFDRRLGYHHDAGWARVCRALGGTGARTHDEEVVYGKGTTYEYTTNTGKTVRVSDRHHNYIQSGRALTWRKGLGTVTKDSPYSIVGVNGRTLAAPVVKTPATHVVPVQNIIGVTHPTVPARVVVQPAPLNVSVRAAAHAALANQQTQYLQEVYALELNAMEKRIARYCNQDNRVGYYWAK